MAEQKLSDQAKARPKKARFKPDAEFDAAAEGAKAAAQAAKAVKRAVKILRMDSEERAAMRSLEATVELYLGIVEGGGEA